MGDSLELPDVDGCFHLVARVYRQAVKDARRGDIKAIEFLDVCCPDWREITPRGGVRMRQNAPKSAKSRPKTLHLLQSVQV
jgi:hypothetical protein